MTEARNADDVDLDSKLLGDSLKSLHGSNASKISEALHDTVLNHVGGDPEALDDDVTVLVVSRS